MTTEEVRDILRMAQLPVSLEKPIGEEEESELGDFVQDEQAESPFDSASLSLRQQDIRRALDSLPERERRVIELRFGLHGRPPADARGGRPRVQRHARAHPPDREQHAEEARDAARSAGALRLRLAARRTSVGDRRFPRVLATSIASVRRGRVQVRGAPGEKWQIRHPGFLPLAMPLSQGWRCPGAPRGKFPQRAGFSAATTLPPELGATSLGALTNRPWEGDWGCVPGSPGRGCGAFLAFASTAGGAIAPWDPQQTNVPSLGWRGEELRLVKCAPEIGAAGQRTDWIVEDWSGDPFDPPALEASTVAFFTGTGEHRGERLRQGGLRLAACRARADQARRLRPERQPGAQAPVPRRLAGARDADDRKWAGTARPTRPAAAACSATRPATASSTPAIRRDACRFRYSGRSRSATTSPSWASRPRSTADREATARRTGTISPERWRDDHGGRLRPDALADVGHPRRPGPHRRSRRSESSVRAAPRGPIDAVDACLGAALFLGDGRYSTGVRRSERAPTIGPFDPLRPRGDAPARRQARRRRRPDALRAGRCRDRPEQRAAATSAAPARLASRQLGQAGDYPYIGVFKCIPYRRDHRCTSTTGSHPATPPNVAPPPFGPAAHNHYAPFYSRWQPATFATVGSDCPTLLRGVRQRRAAGPGTTSPATSARACYDYWQFATCLDYGRGRADALPAAGTTPTTATPDFRTKPVRPAGRRGLLGRARRGAGLLRPGHRVLLRQPGVPRTATAAVTCAASRCSARASSRRRALSVPGGDRRGKARRPSARRSTSLLQDVTASRSPGSAGRETDTAFICTATAIDIDGTPFAGERVCFTTGTAR